MPRYLCLVLLAAATGLTLWSGWIYFADYFAGEPPAAEAGSRENGA